MSSDTTVINMTEEERKLAKNRTGFLNVVMRYTFLLYKYSENDGKAKYVRIARSVLLVLLGKYMYNSLMFFLKFWFIF